MKKIQTLACCLIAALTCYLGAFGPAHASRVVGVHAGDKLTVMIGNQQRSVQVAFVNAPESRQNFAVQSRKELSNLCMGKDARLEIIHTDQRNRIVAVVFCNGKNVAHHQVAKGYAMVYEQYNQDSELTRLQQQAQVKRLGIWQDNVVTPPWEFRKRGSGRLDGQSSFTD